MTAWKLPFIVAAIAVPVAFAFYLGGPAVGVAAGALAAVAIVVIAARQHPRGPIEPAPNGSGARRLLVVLDDPLEGSEAVEEISAAVGSGAGRATVMVLAPARIGFLDRWASDVEAARRDAQRRLVISVAALAAAGIEAEARVGDEDLVQAVEDRLGSFPASEVILVSAGGEEDEAAAAAARELRGRLRVPFRRLATGPAAR
ncbi:MAG TPA: hypothetical protein VGV69_09005 [Solirubrobacterales bacterium]|nr:hypothetical protein [Solirubrobacterales bacterium]